MKRITAFLFALICIFSHANAQTAASLISKWKFREIAAEKKLDSAAQAGALELFSKLSLTLQADKRYKAFFMGSEEGTWEFDETKKQLLLSSNKGNVSVMEVKQLTDQTIQLALDKELAVIFEKTAATDADKPTEVVKTLPLVSATAAQLCRKWYLQKREVPGRSAEQLQRMNTLSKGSFYHFKADNTYDAKALSIDESSTWQFGSNNQSIILGSEGNRKFWKIKSIGENELQVYRGNTEEVWVFSTKE